MFIRRQRYRELIMAERNLNETNATRIIVHVKRFEDEKMHHLVLLSTTIEELLLLLQYHKGFNNEMSLFQVGSDMALTLAPMGEYYDITLIAPK